MENPKNTKISPNDAEELNDVIEFEGRIKGRLTWKQWLIGIGTLGAGSAALAGIVRRVLEILQ